MLDILTVVKESNDLESHPRILLHRVRDLSAGSSRAHDDRSPKIPTLLPGATDLIVEDQSEEQHQRRGDRSE
jgi:hypothetical protein